MVKAIIGGNYIATQTINGITKNQIVTIDYVFRPSNIYIMEVLRCVHRLYINDINPLPVELWDIIISYMKTPEGYEYNYGIFGFHEGNCNEYQLRDLSTEEHTRLIEGSIYGLPQEFYHSSPTF